MLSIYMVPVTVDENVAIVHPNLLRLDGIMYDTENLL